MDRSFLNIKEVQQAMDKLKYISADDEVRAIADIRQKTINDHNSEMTVAEQKGKAEGIAIGKQEGELVGTIKALIERFLDSENLKKIIQRMEKHSLREDFVKQIWSDYVERQDIPQDKNMDNFMEILRNENIVE